MSNCSNCGKEIVITDSGAAHVDGGVFLQKCQRCGWSGGQADKHQACPECGDQTSLVDDHQALAPIE